MTSSGRQHLLPSAWQNTPLREMVLACDDDTTQRVLAHGARAIEQVVGVAIEGLPMPIPFEVQVQPVISELLIDQTDEAKALATCDLYVVSMQYRVQRLRLAEDVSMYANLDAYCEECPAVPIAQSHHHAQGQLAAAPENREAQG